MRSKRQQERDGQTLEAALVQAADVEPNMDVYRQERERLLQLGRQECLRTNSNDVKQPGCCANLASHTGDLNCTICNPLALIPVAEEKIARVTSELDPDAAEHLCASFIALFDQASEWIKRANEIKVTSADQKREMKLARDSRLALKEIRVNADKVRKKLKEDSLRQSRAVDGMYNVLKGLVEPIESYLMEQETFTQRQEEQRKESLRSERSLVLDSFGTDAAVYADLGELSDEQWVLVADNARVTRDARAEVERAAALVREEADRKAVLEREEMAKRIADQATENARLRAEADIKETELRIERDKGAETARLQAVKEEALLMAPDREKLRAFADALKEVAVPVMTTRQGRAAGKKLQAGMTEMIAWVEKVSEELK